MTTSADGHAAGTTTKGTKTLGSSADGVESASSSGVDEVTILWISEGMSCDGDTISITASGQPAIEDVVLGLIPGLPKVNLHNKVLSPTLGGEEFLAPYRPPREVSSASRSFWSSRGRSRTRTSTATATGPPSATTSPPESR